MEAPNPTDGHPPWLDLPHSLTDSILELLPPPDYIRSSAVCTKWRGSFQRRLIPTILPPIPWLRPTLLQQEDDIEKNREQQDDDGDDDDDATDETLILPCFSPFENRLYRLPVPVVVTSARAMASSHGWNLLHEQKRRRQSGHLSLSLRFSLLNPISRERIPLPVLPLRALEHNYVFKATLSAGPRKWAVFIVIRPDIFLLRSGHPHRWVTLPCPCPDIDYIRNVMACGGKFYCQLSKMDLVVVDPWPSSPTAELFQMDSTQLHAAADHPGHNISVGSDEGLLLAAASKSGFHVFKADLSRRMWVRMKSLGDGVVYIGAESSILLRAEEGVGGRRNCIYFSGELIGDRSSWKVFDLGTETTENWPLLDNLSEAGINRDDWRWFVPSLN